VTRWLQEQRLVIALAAGATPRDVGGRSNARDALAASHRIVRRAPC
jgi:hypothetical protein